MAHRPSPASAVFGAFSLSVCLATSFAWAGSTQSIGGAWKLNGNGFPGDVVMTQGPDGSLTGTIYGEPLQGFYSSAQRTAVFLRGPLGNPLQAFVGDVSPDGDSMSGNFYGLNTSNSGATAASNVFRFAAQRGTTAASNPGPAPVRPAGPATVAGDYFLFNRPAEFGESSRYDMRIAQTADGTVTGTAFGETITGHYSSGAGTLAFTRLRAGKPIQFFVAQVTAPSANDIQMRGDFLAVAGHEGGGSLTRIRYDWTARRNATGASAPAAGGFIGPGPKFQNGTAVLPPSTVAAAPVTLSCPASASDSGPSARFSGWSFNSAWAPLLRAEVKDFSGKAHVQCLYGYPTPATNQSYPLQQLILMTSAGAGITGPMCSINGATITCSGRAPLTCPSATAEAGPSRRLGQPWSQLTAWPGRFQRAELLTTGSQNAGVGIQCLYGVSTPAERAEVLLTLSREVGPGITAAKCAVSGASVTCRP